MVHTNLLFESLLGLLSLGKGHDTSIVHQNVKFVMIGIEGFSEGLDGDEIVEVEGHPLYHTHD